MIAIFFSDTGVQEKLGIMNNGQVYAVFDYEAQHADELSLKNGDSVVVLRKGDDNEREWWWSKLGPKEGYIPRNLLGVSAIKQNQFRRIFCKYIFIYKYIKNYIHKIYTNYKFVNTHNLCVFTLYNIYLQIINIYVLVISQSAASEND
jgi:hypothetical protein